MASSKRRQAKQARKTARDTGYNKALQANPGNNTSRRTAVPITPKKRGPRPKDGDVTITRPDGTTLTQRAYNTSAVAKIRREGDQRAATDKHIAKARAGRKYRYQADVEQQRQERQYFARKRKARS